MDGYRIAITGALGALGSALTGVALARGARVAAIDAFPGGQSAATLLISGANLVDPGAAADAIAKAADGLGGLDVLVNVAGGFVFEPVSEGATDTWLSMHQKNVVTALNSSRSALPHLIASGRGAIVNIGAGAGVKAGAGMGAYASSKSGVHRLTESMAEELKGKVTVNAVLPSTIDTPANRRDMPDADFSRWVAPEALSDAILFLATNRAITGALLPVTGGL